MTHSPQDLQLAFPGIHAHQLPDDAMTHPAANIWFSNRVLLPDGNPEFLRHVILPSYTILDYVVPRFAKDSAACIDAPRPGRDEHSATAAESADDVSFLGVVKEAAGGWKS